MLCIGLLVFDLLALPRHTDGATVKGLGLFLASLAMLSSLYIALHWALRPENLFSKGLIGLLSDPISYLSGRN
jgi:hypothetical protein